MKSLFHSHLSTALLLSSLIFAVGCCEDPLMISGIDDSDAVYYPPADSVGELRINELQVIGSHNSFRVVTTPEVYSFVQTIGGVLPAEYDPDGWDYTHVPLPEQLNTYGMRAFELDIFYDPDGGRFSNRQGNLLAGLPVESGIPELDQPGMKVIHIPDFDYNTNYVTFKLALMALKEWSDAHPMHIPMVVNVETKTATVADVISFIPGLTTALPFDAAACDAVDEEIRSVFGADLAQIITPDDVRGTATTLREAILANGWPKLKEARGKILFAMEGDAETAYAEGHPSFAGRAMFSYANEDSDEAAFIIYNSPVEDQAAIQAAVQAGFMVRTRADSDTEEARTGNYTNMNAAFTSGAQVISTDYYRPDPRYLTSTDWTDYHVMFPDGRTWRVNPLLQPGKGNWIVGEH